MNWRMPAMQIDASGPTTHDPTVSVAPAEPLVIGGVILAVAASVAVAVRMIGRRNAGRPIVPWRPHADVPWQGIDVAVVCGAYVVAAALVGSMLPSAPSLVDVLTANLVALGCTMAFAVAHLRLRGADLESLGGDLSAWRADVAIGVGGLALVVAPLLGLATLLDRIVPYEHPLVDLLLTDRSPLTMAVVIVSAVVAAPIAEEFFFRRILQGWLEARLPPARRGGAVLVSATLFALAHVGQGLAPVPLFFLGLVLGWIALTTGSVVGCVLLHALFNAVSVALVLLTTHPAP